VGPIANCYPTYSSMCRGMDAGGGAELHSMWSLVCNTSEYVEELRRCIRDASEKYGVRYTGSYSDRRAWTSSVIEPCSLVEPSTLCSRTGWGSGVVSSWCFHTKSQLINIPVAPESMRAEVETEAREVGEVSSTWRLRECGKVFGRM